MKKTFSVIFALIIAFGSYADNEGNKTKTVKSPEPSSVETMSISGTVLDMVSGETLTGVQISIEGTNIKTYTDFDGNYTVKNLAPGKYNIIASYVSYNKSLVENLSLKKKNQKVEIKMQSSK
ncbi:MAG: carboxypeptidase-like regulatory domain-containing protein [Chlorobi bacterium]|nr:carboxypeptidase-like regulatory domain-containing protein [Chlorobiota bacterium]